MYSYCNIILLATAVILISQICFITTQQATLNYENFPRLAGPCQDFIYLEQGDKIKNVSCEIFSNDYTFEPSVTFKKNGIREWPSEREERANPRSVIFRYNGLSFTPNENGSLLQCISNKYREHAIVQNITVYLYKNRSDFPSVKKKRGEYCGLKNANFWTGEKITVNCTAPKSKLSLGLKWFFSLQNGSTINADAKITASMEYENNYSETAEVKITSTNIKKIGCYAPELNSGDLLNSVNLNVTNSTTPVFDNPKNETVELDLRDEKQKLKCQASGNPIPNITWYKYDKEVGGTKVQTLFVNLTVKNEKVSALTSVFNPRANVVGDNGTIFVCNASNIRGTILKSFTVYLTNKGEVAPPNPPFPPYAIGVIVSCVMLVVLMTALLLQLCRRDNYVRLPQTDEQNFIYGEKPTVVMDNAGTQTDWPQPSPYAMSPYNKEKYEISKSKLEKKEVIGGGKFGVVYRYVWKDAKGERVVAGKTIKDPNDTDSFNLLLEEIKILQHVGDHPNVIQLLGAVTKHIKRLHGLMVVEYCHFGSLKTYLLGHRGSFQSEISESGKFMKTISSPRPPIADGDYVQYEWPMRTSDLIQWSYEIANGMDYIGEKRLVHRDLAARNIVLDSKLVAKITDFGLGKIIAKNTDPNTDGKNDIYIYTIKHGKKNPDLPLPWLAPEIMEEGICSTYSDVWAYGITLWEIFSLGEEPYPGKLTLEIPQFLKDGSRMEKPPFCNIDIYNTMSECWKQTPIVRPPFSELRNTFETLQARLRVCESSPVCPSRPSEGEVSSDEVGNVDSDITDSATTDFDTTDSDTKGSNRMDSDTMET